MKDKNYGEKPEPFIEFVGLSDQDIRRILLDSLSEVIKDLKIDISISFNYDYLSDTPKSCFNVLILWEPASVMPWQYSAANLARFDLVIPMSVWRARNLGYSQHAFHPYRFTGANSIFDLTGPRQGIVMINTAKFSAGSSSLYGLRRETSKLLHSRGLDYKLYGFDWNMKKSIEFKKRLIAARNSFLANERVNFKELTSQVLYRYPEYAGHVPDKFSLLSHFTYSLVIENDLDWVTEKVFDSIFAGTIPIYVGPQLEEISKDLEDCLFRCEPRAQSIYDKLISISNQEIEVKRQAIESFVTNFDFSDNGFWSPSFQWKRVANIIMSNIIRNFNYLNQRQ